MLEIFPSEFSQGQPQRKDDPEQHDTRRKKNAGAAAKKILVQGAGITHQCTDIHFQHDEDAAKVNRVKGRK